MMNSRQLVLTSLLRLENGGYSNLVLGETLNDPKLSASERAFVSTLFYGVIERKLTLDFYISRLSKTKIQKLDKDILCILRMGLYQIIYLDSVPDSAAVNESVRLAKKNKNPRLSGFVNGVLRSFLRERDRISALPKDKFLRKSVMYSCPEWLVKKLCSEYGEDNAEDFLADSLKTSKLFIKTNTVKTDSESLIKKLSDEGFAVEAFKHDPEVLTVSGTGLFSSNAYREGLFHVQDYSSTFAAKSLGAKPGERVLDICAAPGGKTFTIAEKMQNKGEIVACDIHPSRVQLISEGAKRLSLDIVSTAVNDAAVYNEKLGVFDRVLCDAPCSGFGIIGRKPEIKYKSPDEIKDLPQIQLKILTAAARYLKKGGTLIYSTCTLNRDENDGVAERFLAENSDFKGADDFDGKYTKTVFPKTFGSDGFFISKFIKIK